jgi:hypothetical protein
MVWFRSAFGPHARDRIPRGVFWMLSDTISAASRRERSIKMLSAQADQRETIELRAGVLVASVAVSCWNHFRIAEGGMSGRFNILPYVVRWPPGSYPHSALGPTWHEDISAGFTTGCVAGVCFDECR